LGGGERGALTGKRIDERKERKKKETIGNPRKVIEGNDYYKSVMQRGKRER